MGKKQHQKDKLYLTTTEWTELYGGKKDDPTKGSKFIRLAYNCCSMSLQPVEHPYCTSAGVIFDFMNIVPFLKKFGVSPVDGQKMSFKDLIKLTFHKNQDGKIHCPVTFKVFNESSHIVAIRTSGNVFAHEAIEMLNLKPKHLRDLLTDEPFTRQDIITLQDPAHKDRFNLADFHYVRNNLYVGAESTSESTSSRLKCVNLETEETLKDLKKANADKVHQSLQSKPQSEFRQKAKDKIGSAHYSTGRLAASLTSTVMVPLTQQEAAGIDDERLLYDRVKKKAYVRLVTNIGPLNLELHADLVPKICDNFIRLCKSGYYEQCIFHRSIKNFMIQGGDPTGSGKGGASAWKEPIADEFHPSLSHAGRGVLSMANSGPNTNGSQFFLTFRSCKHLDGKHAIFGRLVGGMETLDAMERVATDDADRPTSEIRILRVEVFVDPFKDAEEQLRFEREQADAGESGADGVAKLAAPEVQEDRLSEILGFDVSADSKSPPADGPVPVGKYLRPSGAVAGDKTAAGRSRPASEALSVDSFAAESVGVAKKKKVGRSGLGDFSGW